jgi:DNA-binding MarR family transcriptional regulator
VGMHGKIEPGQQVASVFVPISRNGLSKQLQSHEWRKDLLISWLFQTCIRLQTSLDRRFLRFGMTVQEASVLLRCVEARSITPGQLAVALGRDKGMITRFIDRLEVSRLIVRQNNPRDRRFSVIRPTTKGKQLARALANVFEHIRKELFAGILESDVRGVSRMMALLHKNAVGIGSRQKCDVVRQRRRIGSRNNPRAQGIWTPSLSLTKPTAS